MISTRSTKRTLLRRSPEDVAKQPQSPRTKVWGIGSLALACLASPCCTPLYVPIVLSLLVGTPIAVFLAAFIGWIYAGLTILSLASLYMGWRWLRPLSGDDEVPAPVCSIDCSCQSVESETKP